MNKRDGDELYHLVNDPNETTNVIGENPAKAASMRKAVTAWDESLPPLPRPATACGQNRQATAEPKPAMEKENALPPSRPRRRNRLRYPWQNYNGPLQQNWFDLHDGLKNSQYIFETDNKGTVAFVGGSITGMPWRKKVMANLKQRFLRKQISISSLQESVPPERCMVHFDWIGTSFKKGKVDLLFEEAAVNDVAIGRTPDQIGSWYGRYRSGARGEPTLTWTSS